jgi:transposase
MRKYSDTLKLAAAKDYCDGCLGLKEVARRHGVDVSSLRNWASAYRIHGEVGAKSKRRKNFTAAFKLAVLRRIQKDQLSLRQAGALFNLRRREMIQVWAQAYERGGIDALRSPLERRRMKKRNQTEPAGIADRPTDEGLSRQELLEELRKLRMENAYLKKLEALAQPARKSAHEKEQ